MTQINRSDPTTRMWSTTCFSDKKADKKCKIKLVPRIDFLKPSAHSQNESFFFGQSIRTPMTHLNFKNKKVFATWTVRTPDDRPWRRKQRVRMKPKKESREKWFLQNISSNEFGQMKGKNDSGLFEKFQMIHDIWVITCES